MAQSSASPQWSMSQIFALHTPGGHLPEDNIATAVDFEKSGDYLAVGDQGGRVVILERDCRQNALNHRYSRNLLEQEDSAPSQHSEFRFKLSFQCHETEIDYCMHRAITGRIKKVRWCNTQNGRLLSILSADDKTIKFWKIAGVGYNHQLICKKVYTHIQSSNIHSISNNSDGESFISADDFQINSWNLEDSAKSFTIINMKNIPADFSKFHSERITSAEFYQSQRNLLAYGSSRGFIRLYDLRDHRIRMRSVLEEATKCISDVKFFDDGHDGQHFLSRDYMSMKLWDMRMDSDPVAEFTIHNHQHPRPPELANSNNLIYDRFDCCFSGNGLHFATGSYGNRLSIFALANNGTVEDIKVDDTIADIGRA